MSQNGNVYEEGLGKKWATRAEYWKNPTSELREQYKSAFAPETIIGQYTFGTEEGKVSPDGKKSLGISFDLGTFSFGTNSLELSVLIQQEFFARLKL